jgi:hypothetical protein
MDNFILYNSGLNIINNTNLIKKRKHVKQQQIKQQQIKQQQIKQQQIKQQQIKQQQTKQQQIKQQQIKQQQIQPVKLPVSIYKDKHNKHTVFSYNNGKYIYFNNLIYIFQQSDNIYFNPKSYLRIYQIGEQNYEIDTHKSTHTILKYKRINSLDESFHILFKLKNFNKPCHITFNDIQLTEKYKKMFKTSFINILILFQKIDTYIVLDLSLNIEKPFWNKVKFLLDKNNIMLNKENKIIIKDCNYKDNWKILCYKKIEVCFEKNCKISISSDILKEYIQINDKLFGTCDMSFRS